MTATIVLPTGAGESRLDQMRDFAEQITTLNEEVGFKVSARGWCYELEGFGLINKSQFSRIEAIINEIRMFVYMTKVKLYIMGLL